MQSERYVKVAEVTDSREVVGAVHGDLPLPPPIQFDDVTLAHFRAEYALQDRDITIHFFLTEKPEGGAIPGVLPLWSSTTQQALENWWLSAFPLALSREAKEYFGAESPRIMAKYTGELASWWFKAQGYDYLLDWKGFVLGFLKKLDQSLASA